MKAPEQVQSNFPGRAAAIGMHFPGQGVFNDETQSKGTDDRTVGNRGDR